MSGRCIGGQKKSKRKRKASGQIWNESQRKVLDYFTTYHDEEGEVKMLSETVSAEESVKGDAEMEKCEIQMNKMSVMLGDDLFRENTDKVDKTETISVVRMTEER